jgi:hypothetical protein
VAQRTRDRLAETDPLWAVFTDPTRKGGRWTREDFLATGEEELADAKTYLTGSFPLRQTEQSTTVYLVNPITESESRGFAGVLISDVALKRHFADTFELGVGLQSIWLFNVANVRAMRPLDWHPRAAEPGLLRTQASTCRLKSPFDRGNFLPLRRSMATGNSC